MENLRKGDTVVVIAGKDKGKRGKVLRMLDKKDRVVVEKVAMVKRHTKPSQKNPQGGIIEKEGSVHVSNVMLWDPKANKPTRVKVKVGADGKKVRVSLKSDHEFPSGGM